MWVDIRPDEAVGTLVNLIVGNSGPTVATNIRVSIDPPLRPIEQMKERIDDATNRLASGLPSLAPGRTLSWIMGQGFNLISDEERQLHRLTITADGPFGPMEPNSYVIDLADLRGVTNRPTGSLHEVTKAIDKMSAALLSATQLMLREDKYDK